MTTSTRSNARELAAAIDLGTNTALLLVARRRAESGLDVVEEHCRTPRLGTGLAARGALDPTAVERALDALQFFADRLRALSIDASRTRAVGTAVLRGASDARAFVDAACARTGIRVEIVSADEEARLGSVAVAAEGADGETVIVDVGGGSTQIACPALSVRTSVPIGAVVMTETYLGERALRPGGFEALIAAAREACAAFPAGIARDRSTVALGGTAVHWAHLAHPLGAFDPGRVEGLHVESKSALRFARELAPLDLVLRQRLPIESERALILPAGLAVLGAALERIGAERVRVTSRGLRYGVVRELLFPPAASTFHTT